MEAPRRDDECIEFRSRYLDRSRFFSVLHYDADLRFGQRLSNPRAITFHGTRWTKGAPRVEELTLEWQETAEGRFRICDWDVYDAQMRALIGIA